MHGCYLQWYLQGQVGDMRQQLPDALRALTGEVHGLIAKDNEVRGKKA